jgi:hypothetical protein
LAYWIAGDDPVRYWPMVAVGLLGWTLGPIGFAAGLLQGAFVWKSATVFVFNDLIWLCREGHTLAPGKYRPAIFTSQDLILHLTKIL